MVVFYLLIMSNILSDNPSYSDNFISGISA